MDKFLQATGYYTVEILQKLALVQAVWLGSPIGQATAPYFAKAPAIVAQIESAKPVTEVKRSPKAKCRTIDGKKMCESK
jgi:uncharacterized protein YcfJ